MIFSIIVREKYLYGAFKIIFSPETFSTSLGHTGDNLERRFRRHLGGRGLRTFRQPLIVYLVPPVSFFQSSQFLTKIESSSHPFIALSLLSFLFGLRYGPSLGYLLYSVSAPSVCIQRTFGVSFVLLFLYYFLFIFFIVILCFVPLDA